MNTPAVGRAEVEYRAQQLADTPIPQQASRRDLRVATLARDTEVAQLKKLATTL